MEATSVSFFELFKFLKNVLAYCDILKEIKPKRERIRCLENEMEKSINVLQALSIERNKLEIDLGELKQKLTDILNEKMELEKKLIETENRLVGRIFFTM